MAERRSLSPGQFNDLADQMNRHDPGANVDAGFTVRAYTDEKGEMVPGRNAFMVGGYAPEGETSRPTKGSEISDYVNSNRGAFTRDDMYLGGWSPADQSKSPPVLDASKSFNRNLGGAVEAHQTAERHGEKAVGELNEAGGFTPHTTIKGAGAIGRRLLSGLSEHEE